MKENEEMKKSDHRGSALEGIYTGLIAGIVGGISISMPAAIVGMIIAKKFNEIKKNSGFNTSTYFLSASSVGLGTLGLGFLLSGVNPIEANVETFSIPEGSTLHMEGDCTGVKLGEDSEGNPVVSLPPACNLVR